jgi:hypothetical protein
VAPPTTFIALLIVLALVPGWLYLRLVEPLEAPRNSNGLHQLLEVLAVGAATTGISVLVIVLTPHAWLPFALDIQKWGPGGTKYLRGHLREAAWAAALVLGVSLAIAYGLAKLRHRHSPGEFHHSNTWVQSLGRRPADCVPYLGLHLTDGRLLEGTLHAYDLDSDNDTRDIALAPPIRITPAGGNEAVALPNLHRVVVESSRIEYITVHHLPIAASEPSRTRHRTLFWRT